MIISFIGESPISPTELKKVNKKCTKEFMCSEEHKEKFFTSTLNSGSGTPGKARRISLNEKPELNEEAKSALAEKWDSTVYGVTGMRNYNEFSNYFKEKPLSRIS